MKLKHAAVWLFALAGCTTTPAPLVTTPVETVEVKVPVPVACIDALPEFPELPAIPRGASIDEQTLIRIEREKILRNYAREVAAIARPCIKK